MAYPNGQVPLERLRRLGDMQYLPPGTAARWLWLVAEGRRRFGVTFYVTGPSSRGWDGWNCYRPLDIQRTYKNAFGQWAASPGYSSHGGFYQGQEVFAIDVANWAAVSWSNFVRLCNDAGFRVDFVSPREQWHIGDFNNPWVVPAFAAGHAENPSPAPEVLEEDDEMLMLRIRDHNNDVHLCSLGNGVFRHFIGGDPHDKIMRVSRARDDWQDITTAELPAFLRTYGCDLHIWNVVNRQFVVLDPLSGKAGSGGMWSATNAARAGISAVQVTSDETAAYVQELANPTPVKTS